MKLTFTTFSVKKLGKDKAINSILPGCKNYLSRLKYYKITIINMCSKFSCYDNTIL